MADDAGRGRGPTRQAASSEIASASALLRDAGVADDATPATLAGFAGRSDALDRAIVARLAAVADVAHATALRDLAHAAEARGAKAVGKDARRALYRLSQRGVVPEPLPAAAPTRSRVLASPLEGWLSGIDGRGDRLVWIVRAQPSGGLLAMTAILNEPNGLRDVTLAELSRKALRRMHDDLRARHSVRMVEADGAYCDALVAEGYARARAAGSAEAVGQYPTLRARMTTAPPAPLEPPLIARVAATLGSDSAALADGARLLDEIELVTWLLDRETLAPHLTAIAAARESPLVLSRPQQEERVQAALAEARHALFGGARAAVYRRRLEEMAYVLHATDRRTLAAAATATAAALATGDDATPFFLELLRRSVGPLIAEEDAKTRAEAAESVLVRPGTAPLGAPRRPR